MLRCNQMAPLRQQMSSQSSWFFIVEIRKEKLPRNGLCNVWLRQTSVRDFLVQLIPMIRSTLSGLRPLQTYKSRESCRKKIPYFCMRVVEINVNYRYL